MIRLKKKRISFALSFFTYIAISGGQQVVRIPFESIFNDGGIVFQKHDCTRIILFLSFVYSSILTSSLGRDIRIYAS